MDMDNQPRGWRVSSRGFYAFDKHRAHNHGFKKSMDKWNCLSSAEKQVFIDIEKTLIEQHKVTILSILESGVGYLVNFLGNYGITPGEWLIQLAAETEVTVAVKTISYLDWIYSVLPKSFYREYFDEDMCIEPDPDKLAAYIADHQKRVFQNIVIAFAPTAIHDHVLVTIVDYVISNSWSRYDKMQSIDRCRKMLTAKTTHK